MTEVFWPLSPECYVKPHCSRSLFISNWSKLVQKPCYLLAVIEYLLNKSSNIKKYITLLCEIALFKSNLGIIMKKKHYCYTIHSSEIRGLHSTKCSSETLQNLLYFMYKKTHVVFSIFHFVQQGIHKVKI